MKNVSLKDLKNNNYYLIYGKNWIIIVQLKNVLNGCSDILYLQHGDLFIKSFQKNFLMYLNLNEHEIFELSDEEVASQILVECI